MARIPNPNRKPSPAASLPKLTAPQRLPPPPTTAPRERWHHGSEPEPRTRAAARVAPQQVRSVIGTLLRSERIEGHHALAADRWLRDYEIGILGCSAIAASDLQRTAVRAPEPGGHDRIAVSTVDAITRHREATAAVGIYATRILIAVCHTATSITHLAEVEFGGSNGRHEAVGTVIACLERLSEHYQEVDNRRRDDRRQRARPTPSTPHPRVRHPTVYEPASGSSS